MKLRSRQLAIHTSSGYLVKVISVSTPLGSTNDNCYPVRFQYTNTNHGRVRSGCSCFFIPIPENATEDQIKALQSLLQK